MKFKDVKINQRFRFVDDLKIYKKIEVGIAERGFDEHVIFQDANVELVSDDEEENYEEIERNSSWRI